jgi:hypothetical protein
MGLVDVIFAYGLTVLWVRGVSKTRLQDDHLSPAFL